MFDTHCLKIALDFRAGKITREEAEKEMRNHGDRLIVEMLESSSKAVYANAK